MKKLLVVGIIAVMLFAGIGAVSAANLVTNGGFEADTPNASFQTLTTGLTGWTISSGSIDLIGTYWTSASGSKSIDLAGLAPGTISQVLTTTTNTKYDLSFNLAGNPDDSSKIKKVEVFWDGVSQGIFSFDTTGKSHSAMGWSPVVIPGLVASGTTTELKFVDVSGSSTNPWGAALDDIVVQPQGVVPTPEFPTMALPAALIVGLLGAVLFIQKSKDN